MSAERPRHDPHGAEIALEVTLGRRATTVAPSRPRRNLLIALALVTATGLVSLTDRSDGATSAPALLRTEQGDDPPDAATSATTTAPGRTAVAPSGPVELTTTGVAAPATVAAPPPPAPTTTTTPPTTTPPLSTAAPATPAAVVARPVPLGGPATPPPAGPAPPWTSAPTTGGYIGTGVGCASGTSAGALDAFFRARMGPVIGHDYQHVVDLGGERRLWLFQDTFLDPTGNATRLDQASFAHNTAMVQTGACFTLLHRGTATAPASFEPGTGERTLSRWFWPLGGETAGGQVRVFWAEMAKTADPEVPDGLGWVPVGTWLATYDATSLARRDFRPAPDSGVDPIYGYAVSSDAEHTYLFGNTFDQNLARQGGFHGGCPCSATSVTLARVPRGRLDVAPEYWSPAGWTSDATAAEPILRRYWAENPMQPRFLGGQWVAATKVDGYWGDDLVIDVAEQPWGPWTTVSRRGLAPRGGDRLMNTYHAHLAPWLSGGALVVTVSQNARDMLRDAWPQPERYRLQFLGAALVPPPPPPPPPETTTTSVTTVATDPPATEPTVVDTTPPSTGPPPTDPPATDPCGSTTTAPATTSTSDPPSSTTTSSTPSTSSTTPVATTTTCPAP